MSIPRLIGAVVIVVGWAIRMRRRRRQLRLQPHRCHVFHFWPVCEGQEISVQVSARWRLQLAR